jgi:hypothetical protein
MPKEKIDKGFVPPKGPKPREDRGLKPPKPPSKPPKPSDSGSNKGGK